MAVRSASRSTRASGGTFRIWTIDNMPLSIRDCGVEWDGFDFANEVLDRVEIRAPGPDYFKQIRNHRGVHEVKEEGNILRFKARGWEIAPEDTRHEWTIKIVRREEL